MSGQLSYMSAMIDIARYFGGVIFTRVYGIDFFQ